MDFVLQFLPGSKLNLVYSWNHAFPIRTGNICICYFLNIPYIRFTLKFFTGMENCAIQNAHNDMRRENMEYHLTQNVTCHELMHTCNTHTAQN